MTDDQKIEAIIYSLTNHALGDINRAATGGSKMGAFILCSCLIDAMAGFEKGGDTRGEDFKCFVRRRLGAYDSEQLYSDLRCKLVHSYSEGGSYSFVDAKADRHLQADGPKTVINLENFIGEIKAALEAFAADIRNVSLDIRRKAIQRLNNNGIIIVTHLIGTESSGPGSTLSPGASARLSA